MNGLEPKKKTRHLFLAKVVGYLIIQVFLYIVVANMPWPVVEYETWGGRNRGRLVPDQVFLLFWVQFFAIPLLPLRGKAFLLGQFFVFLTAFLAYTSADPRPMHGAVVPKGFFAVFWSQFVASAAAFMTWRFRRSKLRPWYPLIAYFALELALLSVMAQVRWPLPEDTSTWIRVVFGGQFIGLLFATARFRVFASAQLLLGVSLAALPHWLPKGWYSAHDPISDWLWIAYFVQCLILLWWLIHARTESAHEGTTVPAPVDRSVDVRR